MKQFKWTDELVKEYSEFEAKYLIENTKSLGEDGFWFSQPSVEQTIEAFKQSKQPKQEWEILEYKYPSGKGGEFVTYGVVKADAAIGMEGLIIYTVKRLSDENIFTVGETIDTPQDGTSVIYAFDVTGNRMNVKLNNGTIGLEHIQKANKKKPEWKVISLQRGDDTFNLHLNSMYKSGDVEFSLEHLLNVQKAKIITVQRLSDGEIFSVGEIASFEVGNFEIAKFDVQRDMLLVGYVDDRGNVQYYSIMAIQKAKQPLFTTEDGVPVYDGGEIFVCDSEFKVGIIIISEISYPQKKKLYKFFSTHSAANEYALANKPQLSLSDVEQAYVGDKKSKEYISLIDNLRLIIRQKK